jgi:hypothetical protein
VSWGLASDLVAASIVVAPRGVLTSIGPNLVLCCRLGVERNAGEYIAPDGVCTPASRCKSGTRANRSL